MDVECIYEYFEASECHLRMIEKEGLMERLKWWKGFENESRDFKVKRLKKLFLKISDKISWELIWKFPRLRKPL